MFLELWREIGGPGQTEDIALQDIPAHLVEERVTEFDRDLPGRWGRKRQGYEKLILSEVGGVMSRR